MFFKKKRKLKVNQEQILKAPLPQHIAIILDGNGRWAKKRDFQEQRDIKKEQ